MTRRHENGDRELDNANCVVSTGAAKQNDELGKTEIAALVDFFRLLDAWDRDREKNAKTL